MNCGRSTCKTGSRHRLTFSFLLSYGLLYFIIILWYFKPLSKSYHYLTIRFDYQIHSPNQALTRDDSLFCNKKMQLFHECKIYSVMTLPPLNMYQIKNSEERSLAPLGCLPCKNLYFYLCIKCKCHAASPFSSILCQGWT